VTDSQVVDEVLYTGLIEFVS